jgi:hypothetical protein
MRNAYRILVGKSEGKIPFETPRCTWEDIIKTDIKEIVGDGVDWINLARDRGR